MKEIQLVDLKTQYRRLKSEIDSAINGVLESGYFIKGPQVAQFEKNLATYLGVKHVIGCANGTEALQIAMMALGFEPGDEIITAGFTYVATAEVIALLRLKPVFVEANPHTFNIDPAAIEKAITPKTKAIVPVHLFGQAAEMESILTIAQKHGLAVIEDNAQAIGAVYTFSDGRKQRAGTIGDIGTTSFYPSKNLGAYGDGGALFTNNDNLAAKIRMIANHGQSALYIHDVVGLNSRLDTLQAAILDVKLKYLDEFAKARRKVADFYDTALKSAPGVNIPFRAPYSTHVFHQYTVTLKGIDRDLVCKELNDKGIPARVYYPVPVHLQKAYKDGLSLPVTEKICKSVLSLPLHTELDEEQLKYITETFIEVVGRKNKN